MPPNVKLNASQCQAKSRKPLTRLDVCRRKDQTHLREPNILTLLPEALTADIEAVFPDEARFVGAYAANS